MKEISRKLSEFLADAIPGDPLPAPVRKLIDRAFEMIRHEAHSTAAIRPRGSRLIERVRVLTAGNPDWRAPLGDVEQKVVEVKFGDPTGELSNSETGARLGITKQMVAYHLKQIAGKLETEFGAVPDSTAEKAAHSAVPENADQAAGLMRDQDWQRLLRWRRARTGTTDNRLSNEDLQYLRVLEQRLKDIGQTPDALKATPPNDGKPGRRRSPARYFELRRILLENSELNDCLTPRQQRAMLTGLALDEESLAPETELGFRRFDESEPMTKENFNYMFREVVKRLRLDL